ncbi:MAG TPA: MarR family transcriptional regulator, partial [Hyphomicrobiales bacterium]|nr:MarR family transcriptional regulator [Hyphomicrobiales bacterium]
RLAALAFVERRRSERDKRQFILSVTPSGQATLDGAPDLLQMTFTERFSQLPAWEQALILTGMEKLALLLGAEELDAAPLLDSGAIDRTESRQGSAE